MKLPNIDWKGIANDFAQVFEASGVDAEVRLLDGVTTFKTKVTRRRAPVENLTDGLQQNANRVSLMAGPWIACAGRAPMKGDQLVIDGRRQAVQSAQPVYGGNELVGYTLTVLG